MEQQQESQGPAAEARGSPEQGSPEPPPEQGSPAQAQGTPEQGPPAQGTPAEGTPEAAAQGPSAQGPPQPAPAEGPPEAAAQGTTEQGPPAEGTPEPPPAQALGPPEAAAQAQGTPAPPQSPPAQGPPAQGPPAPLPAQGTAAPTEGPPAQGPPETSAQPQGPTEPQGPLAPTAELLEPPAQPRGPPAPAVSPPSPGPPVRSLCGALSCSLCRRIYSDPVELPCQHFNCRACITQHWQEKGPSCPQCGADCQGSPYKTNPLLTGLLECLKLQGTGVPRDPLCAEHGKKLERYCVTDSEVICLDCRDSRKHQYHEVLNTQEAAEEFKDQLKKSMKNLESERELHWTSQTSFEALLLDISSKTKVLEEQIKTSFETLHVFLREEESALLQELHKEEDLLRQTLAQRIAQLSQAVDKLSSSLQEVEKNLQQDDTLSFLQNFRDTQERARVPQITVDRSLLELKVENYSGPVQFWVWKKMLKVLDVAPEVMKLDQNTASPFLVITDSVKVRCGDKKRPVPDVPERFDPAACVLAATGFDQGRHYWEVMVGQKSEWGLGVAKESVTRKGEIMLCPANGFWAVVRNGKDYRAFTLPPTPLPLERKPQRVGVYLDYEKGQVSFYDPDKMTHFHTFSDTFTEKVYPFFFTGVKEGKGEPLRILQFRL